MNKYERKEEFCKNLAAKIADKHFKEFLTEKDLSTKTAHATACMLIRDAITFYDGTAEFMQKVDEEEHAAWEAEKKLMILEQEEAFAKLTKGVP